MRKINVVSFFNGMNCGMMALENMGIEVDKYYSFEIDKHAIKSTQTTHPNTIQKGSVVDFNVTEFPKIDLFIGGSPCQSFSFAGKRKGMSTKDDQEVLTLDHYLQLKDEGYEFEGQSYLFWEYMRALTDLRKVNPDIKFLLENVMMGEKWEKILTKTIGVNPIEINSALVSAQNRRRLYWTNIGMEPAGLFGDLESIIQQPKDKGILLKDILETEVDEKYFLSDKMIAGMINHTVRQKEAGRGYEFEPSEGNEKGKCLRANVFKMGADDNYIVHNTMPRSSITGKGGTGHLSRTDGKTYCLDTGNTNAVEIPFCVAMRGRNPENPKSRKSGLPTEQMIEPRFDEKSGSLTTVQKDNLVLNKKSIRRLTPRECGRLQTVPAHHLETMLSSGISDTQLYKMFGNGWTVDVITHIFKYLEL